MKIVNQFLDEGVRQKFRTLNEKQLVAFINKENLPMDYGGTAPKISDYEE